MAVIAFTSVAGSPGVTTAATALAVHWPRPVLLVEADDSAATTLMLGFFRSNLHPDALGMRKVVYAYQTNTLHEDFILNPEFGVSVPVHDLQPFQPFPIPALPQGHRMWVLPGFNDLSSVTGLRSMWPALGPVLWRVSQTQAVDVLIDLSRLRLDDPRLPLIDLADRTVILTGTTLVDINRLHRRVNHTPDLADRVAGIGRAEKFKLLTIDAVAEGQSASDFAQLIAPVIAGLPFDPAGAAVFSVGRQDVKPARNAYRQAIIRAAHAIADNANQTAERRVG